jgi:transposase-like protein
MSKRNRMRKVKRLRELEIRCLKYLRRVRWPAGVRCICNDPATGRDCRSKNVLTLIRSVPGRLPRLVFQCRRCRQQFGASTRTIFERSHVPLYQWFRAVRLYDESATDLAKELNVPYKTAWRMKQAIRNQIRLESREHDQLISVLRKRRFMGRIAYAYMVICRR